MDPLEVLSRLAGSSLPAFGREGTTSTGIPAVNGLGTSNSGATNGGTSGTADSSANPFLSGLTSLRSTTSPTASSTPSAPLIKTPDQRVEDHIHLLISKLVEKEQSDIESIVNKMYEQRVQEAHEADMKRYVAELHGNRTLGGSSRVPVTSSGSGNVTEADELDASQVSQFLQVVHKWNRNPQASLDHVLGAFQNISMTPEDDCAWRLLESIVRLNELGPLSFYCHQYQQIVKNRVRQGTAAGQDTTMPYSLSNGMARIVASFVKLTTNITTSPWPVVYYSLRCGDAVAALHVLDATNSQVDAPVRQVMSSLSQTQGQYSCLWDAAPPVVSTSDRQAVAALYDRSKHQDSMDVFQVACLALLAVKDAESFLSSQVVKTTEDYMFGGLWFALQQSYPRDAMMELGNNIQELGASNFPTETEWGYALPLMAAQQYRASLTHVAKTNILQATHVAMVFSAAGASLANLGENNTGSCLLTTLLLDYASKLQKNDAVAAMEYLARIPNEKRAQSEVARLIVDSQELDNVDVRLEELFQDKAPSVLVEAAQQATTRGNNSAAAHLLLRAHRYDLLLKLLNRQLSSEMMAGGQFREWHDKCAKFHAQFLAIGHDSQVMRLLQETDSVNHLKTFQILMDLHRAFECVHIKDYKQAWELLERLPLLPCNEQECEVKANQFASLDQSLKTVFPLVLEKAMESLGQLYFILKSAGQSTNQEQQRLRSLAQLLLFSFTGRLQHAVPSDVVERMTAIEGRML